MKTKNLFCAALSMTAALMMTACSSDDNDTTTASVAPSTTKIIPYTVTVGGDDAMTRATVDGDNRTLRFATGDKLYITGTNIKGVLNITDGVGSTNQATFSGELTYSVEGSPADDLSLTATLVSAQQTVDSQVSVDDAGAVTVNYPTTAYCSSVNDAVQQYSRLTGTSTYGSKVFRLQQQTAFLNFVITFEDGTATGTELSAVVSNNSATVCTANVTTTTESEKVVAKFVLPVAKGITLSSAKVTMDSKEASSFGASPTLDGKVYNVTRTQAAAAELGHALSASVVGELVGSDGKAYAVADKDNLPQGVTAVAMVAYRSETAGSSLAIQLNDSPVEETWSEAKTYAEGLAAVSGGTWRLPSKEDWQNMFVGCAVSGDADASDYMDPITGFKEKIGATRITSWQSGFPPYWSSTGSGSDACYVYVLLGGSDAYADFHEGVTSTPRRVLGCLAF